jgi:hypothetical protein
LEGGGRDLSSEVYSATITATQKCSGVKLILIVTTSKDPTCEKKILKFLAGMNPHFPPTLEQFLHQIKEDEMGGACSTAGRDKKHVQNFD